MGGYWVKSSIYFSSFSTYNFAMILEFDCTSVFYWKFMNPWCVHHRSKEVNHFWLYFILCEIRNSCDFQSECLFCFFNRSILWFLNNLLNHYISLLSRFWLGRFFLFLFFFLWGFLCIFFACLFGLGLFLPFFYFLLFFLLNPVKLCLGNKSPHGHWIIPIIIILGVLFDFYHLAV